MSDTENRCSLSAFKACTLSSAFITNDTLLLLPPYEIIRTGISFNALMMRASKPTFCHSRSKIRPQLGSSPKIAVLTKMCKRPIRGHYRFV